MLTKAFFDRAIIKIFRTSFQQNMSRCQLSTFFVAEDIPNCNPCVFLESISRRCSVKRNFLKLSENAQENTCV